MRPSLRRRIPARRGFSLIEVLLAIFILGIGIISIGAIFPAAIVQQRQSFDDAMGPLVAENALALLRTRLRQSDFGFAEDFEGYAAAPLDLVFESAYGLVNTGAPRVLGDWGWRRPAMLLQTWAVPQRNFTGPTPGNAVGGAVPSLPAGTLLVFNSLIRPNPSSLSVLTQQATLSEVPWNWRAYSEFGFPLVTITPQERTYPQPLAGESLAAGSPRYFWECMFRRFQGRVQVAIFVYRVVGEEQYGPYSPSQAQTLVAAGGYTRTGIPYRRDFDGQLSQWQNLPHPTLLHGPPPTGTLMTQLPPEVVPGTNPGSTFDLNATTPVARLNAQWQLPGQWLLDPNANILRIQSGRRVSQDGPVRLAAPMPRLGFTRGIWQMGPLPDPTTSDNRTLGSTGTIWYLPAEDNRGYRITPVFVTVKEL